VLIDGVVLAGGRSSRLGSVPKANLVFEQQSLLTHAIQAASITRRTVVVGPVDALSLPGDILVTRESPPFGGPPPAVAAGLSALAASSAEPSDCILVLACDMPRVAAAATALLAQLPLDEGADGLIAVDHRQKLQPLAAVYRTERLAAAVDAAAVDSLPMFRLIAGLNLTPVTVPAGSTDDIDTWVDAARFGVNAATAKSRTGAAAPRKATIEEGVTMTEREEEDEMLRQWCEKLAEALDVAGLTVELKPLLGLAGRAAHGILRPAAPLTTFIVGYAAGLAAGSGKADPAAAVQSATDTAFQLVRDTAEHAQAREA
jgi:molybdopterin-guanine dinucleotide biosynthesis protein A